MKALADLLAPFVDRPIVDMTALEGRYDVSLQLTPEDFQPLMSRSAAVAVPDALERIGLKLRASRSAIEMLVVDSIERTPTEN